jgi:hypothetical protein
MMGRESQNGIVWGKLSIYGNVPLKEIEEVLISIVDRLGTPDDPKVGAEERKELEEKLRIELSKKGMEMSQGKEEEGKSGEEEGIEEEEPEVEQRKSPPWLRKAGQ